MLQIGFDAKRLFHNFTGLGNYSRTLVGDLRRFFPENEYHLFTPKPIRNEHTEPFFEKSNFNIHFPEYTLFKSYWRTFGLSRELTKRGISVYHGLSHELPACIHKTGVKSIVTIHDLIIKRYPEFFPFIDRRIYDRKFRHACQRADVVIAISENTKKDIVEFYKIPESKIRVIYQTCHSVFQSESREQDVSGFSKKEPFPDDFILYVGAITERKNLLGCVRALELLPDDLKLPLVVIGEGKKYKREVQKYIRRKGLDRWVIFYGHAQPEAMVRLYKSARILLYPSFYEGFGLPIIEALFCRTPVITSNTSSMPEAGGPGAIYVRPHDPDSIAAAIEQLLTDESFYQSLSAKGFEYVQKFKAEKVTAEVMRVYRDLDG